MSYQDDLQARVDERAEQTRREHAEDADRRDDEERRAQEELCWDLWLEVRDGHPEHVWEAKHDWEAGRPLQDYPQARV